MKGECDACGFENIEIKEYQETIPKVQTLNLCDVCASTRIGNAHQFPRQYGNVAMLRTIGYTTNLLLRRIAELEMRINEISKVDKP